MMNNQSIDFELFIAPPYTLLQLDHTLDYYHLIPNGLINIKFKQVQQDLKKILKDKYYKNL